MTTSGFSSLGLDPRITLAIARLSFASPTLVQATAIPLALQGKDILARAKTGSGKTAAYCIPVIEKILSKNELSCQALILVPTRELALQVTKVILDLCLYCAKEVKCTNIALGDISLAAQIPLLAEYPHIIVSTPARIRQHLEAGNVILRETLESLVIDEADLILSYGYDEDVSSILKFLPQIYQSYLMSATLSADVEKLKKLILRKPAVLKLEDNVQEDLLTQYYINCSDEEKYLLTLFILKLRVHPFGSHKSLIFVNTIDKCYKLKLFLEQFGIKSCTLNSELPVKSRYHIVEEFNRGIYDYIIATDEAAAEMKEDDMEEEGEGEMKVDEVAEPVVTAPELVAEDEIVEVEDDNKEEEDSEEEDDEEKEVDEKEMEVEGEALVEEEEKVPAVVVDAPKKQHASKSKKRFNHDGEYGVARGIDFKNVTAVINFDMPRSSRSYQHRVGRTARGVGNKGYALTFVCPPPKEVVHTRKNIKPASSKIKELTDDFVLGRIEKRQQAIGRTVLPFKFDMTPVERFRYRCTDALRAVTATAVREARVKELKMEILNSEKLKTHFEDNPIDLAALRHDKAIHPTKVQPHMRRVPDYLLPKGRVAVTTGGATGGASTNSYVPFRVEKKTRGGAGGKKKGGVSAFKKTASATSKRKSDPLKSFTRA